MESVRHVQVWTIGFIWTFHRAQYYCNWNQQAWVEYHPLFPPPASSWQSFNEDNLAFGRGVVYVNHSVNPFGGEDI